MFGDSVSKGVVLDAVRNRYTFLKEGFVSAFSSATGVAVDNFSKFGCTVGKGLGIVLKHSDTLSKYDYVVLEFGGNDCNFDWAEIAAAPEAEHLPATPLDTFITTYKTIIKDIRENGGRPVILSLPPIDSQKFFNWVSRGLNADNILKWLGDVDRIFRWQRSYNDAVLQIAEETKTPLIDIRSGFLSAPDFRELICEDGMHPSPEGHKLIFKTVKCYAESVAV
jgi:Lysophospholipase L1 and related esterases